ncbi:putative oxidoreductase [Planctomycetes bacterium Pan216]|uniref:Putative oxidoreductase n=1 Tax=Kolteria novifilia TaxID=2527975 RepID=A0A518B7I6_9BACT|nr:putative oxidoreductase [Planctomycetes bacterium Pan216]
MASLEGKTAIVTGAGSGIGRATARALADAGMKVLAVSRTEKSLLETTDYATSGKLIAHTADVGKDEDAKSLYDLVDREGGVVDLLVNNAGINVAKRRLEEVSAQDFRAMVETNLVGLFLMTAPALERMRPRKKGTIVTISSIAGLRPSVLAGMGYCASKSGATFFGQGLQLEEAEHGIRSTVICPGEVNTGILDKRPAPVPEELRAVMLQPEDVASAVLFAATLHPRATVPMIVMTPSNNPFV